MLISERESTALKYLNDLKAFIEQSNDRMMVFIKILKNAIEIKNKLTAFDDMIADMFSNKTLNLIVIEFFIRERKLNISLAFITQSYFAVPKNIRLNSTHYFVIIFLNEQELQQIAFNYSSDIEFQNFMNHCKKCYVKWKAYDSSVNSWRDKKIHSINE